jgi:Uma2 family endonuclease
MPEDALLEPLLKSPRLLWYRDRINTITAQELARRERFYEEMDERKLEFINGEVVVHSPVRLDHDCASKLLFKLIDTFAYKHQLGYTGHEKLLICLTRNDYEPDICFWKLARSSKFVGNQMKFPAPDFVAEILSQSTESIDRGVKFDDFAAHGVGEYWIIDAAARTIEKYVLAGSAYKLAVKVDSGTIRSDVIAGFEIPVAALFDEQANLQQLSRILGG